MCFLFFFFFFFKQKTAYEITYGDWSSDVCSSDLVAHRPCPTRVSDGTGGLTYGARATHSNQLRGTPHTPVSSIARSSPFSRAAKPSSSGTPGSAPSMKRENRPMSRMLSGGISILTKSTDGRANPACTHRSEYSSGVRNCRATAWSECLTSIPRSRSTCTARTTQRRQKAPVPSTYAPLKKVVLNAKTPSLFNVLRISAMTCALSGTRWIALRNTTASTEDTIRDTHSALPSMNFTTWEWIAARAFESADGEGSMPITSTLRASPPRRSRISLVTAPGPHPRSTILRRPGPITRSTIHRLTSVKNG